jgi:undecaprenyl-diphosphatase
LALVIWLGDGRWRSWGVHLLVAVGVLAVVVLGLKLLVRRRRPPGEWGAIYRSTDPHSFPSGHAARAVLLAILIAAWGPAWAAPLAIVWAPLVALARVALGVHYLSDVIAGGLLGIGAALTALTLSAP